MEAENTCFAEESALLTLVPYATITALRRL